MDTSNIHPSDDMERFKEEVHKSCKNIFFIAENAISRTKSLKRVVILEHPPRFDRKEKDPLSLKPEFAKYANSLYRQLWFESSLKDKIVIGQHNLECSEKARLDRYTDRKNNRYDGIHMYSYEGKIAYTDSVMSILSVTINLKEPRPSPRLRPSPVPRPNNHPSNEAQTKYMNDQGARINSQYSVPVANRFTQLGN